MRLSAALLVSLLLTSCEPPHRPPPPALWFEGLPVRGSKADAVRAGFTDCMKNSQSVRCLRNGVMLLGHGPYVGVVNALYSDGSGGFDELTFYHDRDQGAVLEVGALLEQSGWQICRTGQDESRGDQVIYTRAGSPVRFSMDLSYWGKRRLRILPERNQPKGHCW
jgi:hypothetical protein